jgi:hypothetical protein
MKQKQSTREQNRTAQNRTEQYKTESETQAEPKVRLKE